MNRTLLTLLGILIFATFLRANTIKLTYWPASNPEEIKLAKHLIALWHQKNPKIRIHMQPLPAGRSSEEVLLAAIVGKTTPDICSNISPSIINKLIHAKGVVCIDNFKNSRKYLQQRMSSKIIKSFCAKDGKLYQIPWKCNPTLIAYNTKILQQFKIKPPKTYSEFWKAAKKLARDIDHDGSFDRWPMAPPISVIWYQRLFDFYTFYAAASSGKTLLKNDFADFASAQNKKAAIAVFNFFRYGFGNKFFPKIQYPGNEFLEGKVAMQIVGPWKIAEYEKYKSKDFRYDFMAIPKPDDVVGPSYTYGDPKNMVIFSTCKYPQAAWKFVQFLVSQKADYALLEICWQLPIRTNLSSSYFAPIFQKQPMLKKFAQQVAFITSLDASSHLIEIMDNISEQYEACSIYGVIPASKAVENAKKRIEKLLKYW